MPVRSAVTPLVAILVFSNLAAAQGLTGTVLVRVAGDTGAPGAGALVELVPQADAGLLRSARVGAAIGSVSILAPPGEYRLRITGQGLRALEQPVIVEAGEVVVIGVHLVPSRGPGESSAEVIDRYAPAYQTAFDDRYLDALPHSRTVWSLLETAHPFLVADRIDGGGLWTGERASVGGQGSSAAQTTFRLDGVDVTDPESTGASLFFPDLGTLQSVTVGAASVDASAAGPGPTIDMVLPQPSVAWKGLAQVSGSPAGLQSGPGDIAPIARLESWVDGSASAGGAIAGARTRLFASGRITSGRRFEREDPLVLEGSAHSFTAHLVSNPTPSDEVRVLGGFVDATRPLSNRARFADRDLDEQDQSLVLHASWGRTRASGQWSIGGAYQRASHDANVSATAGGGVMERLRDGPPLRLVEDGSGARERWTLTAQIMPATRRWLGTNHVVDAGGAIGDAGATRRPLAQPAFGESVDGQPARVWDVSYLGPESRWSAATASAFVTDRVLLSDVLTLSGALRFDADRGSADGGVDRIQWFDVSPRITARWRPLPSRALSITTGYGWYRQRLPLGVLAVGDPSGPSGVMYRWDDRNGDRTWTSSELTAVAAVGLCCASAEPSRIDTGLRRPTTREFRIGAEDVIGSWRWAITGLDRREDDLMAMTNVGVTLDDYTVHYVDDPGVDIAGLSGSSPLPIYDRTPESFLQDRYLLTNTSAQPSRYQGVDVALERTASDSWFFRFGGTAYRSEGVGASRGYRADENDQGLLGEAFLAPNAETNARGRLFSDRAYMMKVLGAYSAPSILRGSFVARYQDGQPFARMVVAQGLNQGTDLVQSYPRGGQRFTYTLTVDARVVAEWPLPGNRAVGLTFDVFNLLNMANEVEEDVVTGPSFRTVTAVQPPRVIRVGARVAF